MSASAAPRRLPRRYRRLRPLPPASAATAALPAATAASAATNTTTTSTTVAPLKAPPTVALLIVDVQKDFCTGGSLAVPDGEKVVPVINDLRRRIQFSKDNVFLSQDNHPADHSSFAVNNPGKKEFETVPLEDGTPQVMWPVHCVKGTPGAKFHLSLTVLDTDVIVEKGTDPSVDSYSAFWDNCRKNSTNLEQMLFHRCVLTLFVCGLATDYCVSFSAIDAATAGFSVYFIEEASRGITPKGCEEAIQKMRENGVKIIRFAGTVDRIVANLAAVHEGRLAGIPVEARVALLNDNLRIIAEDDERVYRSAAYAPAPAPVPAPATPQPQPLLALPPSPVPASTTAPTEEKTSQTSQKRSASDVEYEATQPMFPDDDCELGEVQPEAAEEAQRQPEAAEEAQPVPQRVTKRRRISDDEDDSN